MSEIFLIAVVEMDWNDRTIIDYQCSKSSADISIKKIRRLNRYYTNLYNNADSVSIETKITREARKKLNYPHWEGWDYHLFKIIKVKVNTDYSEESYQAAEAMAVHFMELAKHIKDNLDKDTDVGSK